MISTIVPARDPNPLSRRTLLISGALAGLASQLPGTAPAFGLSLSVTESRSAQAVFRLHIERPDLAPARPRHAEVFALTEDTPSLSRSRISPNAAAVDITGPCPHGDGVTLMALVELADGRILHTTCHHSG